MRTIKETCRHCYWSATTGPVRDGKFVCNKELGTTKKSIPIDGKDSCEKWTGDRAQ